MKTFKKTIIASLLISTLILGTSCAVPLSDAKLDVLDKTEVNSFDTLIVDVDLGNINFIPTEDEFAIEYQLYGDTEYNIDDGLFVLRNESNGVKLGLDDIKDVYVNIYVPADTHINSAEFDIDLGNIEVKDFSIGNTSAQLDCGNITFTNCTLDCSDISLALGNCDITDTEITTTIRVINDCGNITLDLNNDDISYDLSTSLGAISVNGVEENGADQEVSLKNDSFVSVTLEDSLGNITLNY